MNGSERVRSLGDIYHVLIGDKLHRHRNEPIIALARIDSSRWEGTHFRAVIELPSGEQCPIWKVNFALLLVLRLPVEQYAVFPKISIITLTSVQVRQIIQREHDYSHAGKLLVSPPEYQRHLSNFLAEIIR